MLSRIPAVSGVSAPSGGCQLAGSRHFGSFRHRLLSSPPRLLASLPHLMSSTPLLASPSPSPPQLSPPPSPPPPRLRPSPLCTATFHPVFLNTLPRVGRVSEHVVSTCSWVWGAGGGVGDGGGSGVRGRAPRSRLSAACERSCERSCEGRAWP